MIEDRLKSSVPEFLCQSTYPKNSKSLLEGQSCSPEAKREYFQWVFRKKGLNSFSSAQVLPAGTIVPPCAARLRTSALGCFSSCLFICSNRILITWGKKSIFAPITGSAGQGSFDISHSSCSLQGPAPPAKYPEHPEHLSAPPACWILSVSWHHSPDLFWKAALCNLNYKAE